MTEVKLMRFYNEETEEEFIGAVTWDFDEPLYGMKADRYLDVEDELLTQWNLEPVDEDYDSDEPEHATFTNGEHNFTVWFAWDNGLIKVWQDDD